MNILFHQSQDEINKITGSISFGVKMTIMRNELDHLNRQPRRGYVPGHFFNTGVVKTKQQTIDPFEFSPTGV